ncbi:MAG TPA: glycosyltransferase family 2 protein, partial [Alphaproteobacteria bacterium]|nr:glycosyltransferase family 2 protein [Alphaproteobacteria bacterium]
MPPLNRKALVSIVIPVYNEEMNVRNALLRVKEVFTPLADQYDFECVFTDNHSTDRTFDILKEMAAEDPRVRAYRFSRNFGYQKSILAAYSLARGDCAVQLDCDLQDPPELISQFLAFWREGYKVVYGIRRTRQESPHIEWMRKGFYRLIDALSEDHLPHDAGDFRLVDRRVLDELVKIKDYHIYIRGRLAVMGFSQIGIPYDRAQRLLGESKFRLKHMVNLAVDALLSHSVAPLRLATWCGLAATLAAIGLAGGYFIMYACFGQEWPAG